MSNNAAKMSKIWDTGFTQTSFSHTHWEYLFHVSTLFAFLNRTLFQKILLQNCFLQVKMVILWDYSDYHNLKLLYLQYLGSWPSLLYCSQLALWMNRLLNGHYPTNSVWFTEPTFLLMLLWTFLPFQLFSLIQQGK